ncbi:UNVERIFIED_CONTAM: hypothetical protein HDU68_007706 [Siphonaria sp. JEL0065]|nr:hypothetical protein HDU68_007706 [Siphonaria sp. JEL0065]
MSSKETRSTYDQLKIDVSLISTHNHKDLGPGERRHTPLAGTLLIMTEFNQGEEQLYGKFKKLLSKVEAQILKRHDATTAVADKSEVEQSNLAIVLAPALIRTPDGTEDAAQIAQRGYASMANMPFHNKLIESMIEQYDWLFDGSKD